MSKYLNILNGYVTNITPVAKAKVEAALLAHLLEDKHIPENVFNGLKEKFPAIISEHENKIVVTESAEKHIECYLPADYVIACKYRNKIMNAQKRGIQFSLTFTQFKKLLQRKTCGYTGMPLDMSDNDSDMSPTIERIDGNKGYVQGNCIVVASKYNQLKNELFENSSSKTHCSMQGVYNMMLKLKELGQIK